MTDKFKNCFIDTRPDYEYTIEYDGDVIATAKSMSANDRSKIEKQAMTKKLVNGEFSVDVDSHALKTATIVNALIKWESERDLNWENVSLLPEEYRDAMFNAIMAHENGAKEAVETNEKN